MEVNGPGSIGASYPIREARPAQPLPETAAPTSLSPRDEVDISAVGRMLDDASRTPGIREQRLAEIKAAIEAGTYETPEKLAIALDSMFGQIGDNPTS